MAAPVSGLVTSIRISTPPLPKLYSNEYTIYTPTTPNFTVRSLDEGAACWVLHLQ